MPFHDVIIIGAGAAGLMCAIQAGKRGRNVLLLDHAKKIGEKIRISGGGRCNFTNLHASPEHFLSHNKRFCVSALKRFTQHDFIKIVGKHNISYHEKTLGQLFCDTTSKQIIDMLVKECEEAGATIQLHTDISKVSKTESGFEVETNHGVETCSSLVVATGGLSIPKIGATGLGYGIAKKFGLNVTPTRAALVPFTLEDERWENLKQLAGVALDVRVTCGKQSFDEGLLFTHRGLSGPAILQISSYWQRGEGVRINFLPNMDVLAALNEAKKSQPKQEIQTFIAHLLPKRLAQYISEQTRVTGRLADLSKAKLEQVAKHIQDWQLVPDDTEGFRTAEVTIGGVDTDGLSSKTMESKAVTGLYFIGEVVDVTGHLGGFNFQWAWSSGFAAGQYV